LPRQPLNDDDGFGVGLPLLSGHGCPPFLSATVASVPGPLIVTGSTISELLNFLWKLIKQGQHNILNTGCICFLYDQAGKGNIWTTLAPIQHNAQVATPPHALGNPNGCGRQGM
jgi:hypothetical protein